MSDPEKPRSPFEGSLQFDTEAWDRAGCPTLESAFVAWQAAEERANTAEAELRETAGFVEQLKARIDRGNALRATADGRVSELEMALENTVASARGRGERALAAESALRALQERVEKAIAELEDDSDSNLTDNIDLALAALRG